jgi:hypothetical protein
MTYVPEDGQVLYQSKNGKQTKTFDEKFLNTWAYGISI